MTSPSLLSWQQWVRRSPLQAALTLSVALYGLYLCLPVMAWLTWNADWQGVDRSACTGEGACWVFIRVRLGQFIFGFYPHSELWRPSLMIGIWAVSLWVLLTPHLKWPLWVKPGLVCLLPLWSWALLEGRSLGLPAVETEQWGGLLLTLLIAGIGIAVSLPGGILLALGRRSTLPLVRYFSIGFIEIWRGVPLITVLFMASVMLPLFLPPGMEVNKLLRTLVGVSCFASAYMAEVVRGGLQAVPRGQFEAAAALNLSASQTMSLVILPQALRHVIPGIVNTFIGLFKDTSLVLIVSMFDLLGIVQAASTDPEWTGFALEGYLFAALVFWIFCFAMSRYSLRLEHRLHAAR